MKGNRVAEWWYGTAEWWDRTAWLLDKAVVHASKAAQDKAFQVVGCSFFWSV